ncbi:DUF3445 domain-containing protein [Ammoniphilus sp. YIM 78166]|uniref:heme-dependent oxidative N-demethylase family protein n=1 Tax=Ammoniphilus sp. YIM 78166 TaxID=1644106 RepID=UPI00106F1096|nr:DUF3445 domain-containing protein [Ammoniphilus sp. YIM 78166]
MTLQMTQEKIFPFPFKADSYRYSNNSVALDPPFLLDITPEYFDEVEKKRTILNTSHERSFQALPHSIEAQWEILEMIMAEMTSLYPTYFQLEKNGDHWTFTNHLLSEQQTFIFGDPSSLPFEPLDYIGRHIQEDLIYVAQRDGDLYMDAGQLCFPANWSIAFNLGMAYTEFHSPVPHFSSSGLAEKVKNFLLRMEPGKPWTRLNWTMTVEPILDTFPESFDMWGPIKDQVTAENVGQCVYLRVEDQKLFRLPGSNGILFSIHTHLMALDELIQNEEWATRLYHVLTDLPEYIAEYKGFLSYKDKMVEFLKKNK